MLDPSHPLFLLYFACAVTAGLFTAAAIACVVVGHRRYARIARARGSELGGLWAGLAPAWYAGSLVFGVGGIVAGFYLLRAPRTARQGYACVVLGAVHVVVLVLATCIGLVLFARAYAPRIS